MKNREYSSNDEKKDKEQFLSDEYDIVQHIVKVHNYEKGDLDENFTLTKFPDEKWAKFVMNQHILAKKVQRFIKQKEIADYTYGLFLTQIKDMAILYRNKKDNFILAGILDRGSEGKIKASEEEKGIVGGLKNLFKKDKKSDENREDV